MRDLPYLREGLFPQEESGEKVEKLKYNGDEYEQLSDSDIRDLAEAL